jgi:iron uptake system component EfeO
MKDKWRACRTAWEHIEGAVAPLVPDIDTSIDARYEDFLQIIGPAGDQDLFDDKGVIGMHAVERILYAPGPQRAIDFEQQLQGYRAAAFPATEQEATDFKTKLVQKFVADVSLLQNQWQPAKIDPSIAWGGLVSLMNGQREKVSDVADGKEESRYAAMTLFDLRNNLDGTKKAYIVFQPWLTARPSTDPTKDGTAADKAIIDGFATLGTLYGSYAGDGIPEPPPTWSALHPSDADLQTPFGKLFSTVTKSVDPTTDGSVVSAMNVAANVFGFPPFKQGN